MPGKLLGESVAVDNVKGLKISLNPLASFSCLAVLSPVAIPIPSDSDGSLDECDYIHLLASLARTFTGHFQNWDILLRIQFETIILPVKHVRLHV